jgi:YegS/Rv2252/BmrU family lipid kinase
MKKLFIINPKSGAKKNGQELARTIKQYFPSADICFTKRKGHAQELAAQAQQEGYKQIIVAGGDGTINEVVQSLAGARSALGVIALGSGNGFAREIGMPLNNFDAACQSILRAKEVLYDLGIANNEYFINLSGLGFEADIASAFDKHGSSGRRGALPYFEIGFKKFFNYAAPQARVELDGEPAQIMRPLTLVFSNGRQYGSGFKIAPLASFNDGLLDMVAVEKTSVLRLLLGLPNFFKTGLSPVEIRKSRKIKKATVHIEGGFNYHIDGEPRRAPNKLEISVAPNYIKLLVCGNGGARHTKRRNGYIGDNIRKGKS